MGRASSASSLSAIPLFPLPNVVLLPRAVLPLHIFEQRYRQMTADVLAGGRQIAMALLKKGWQDDYYARPAIEPIVCVGSIVSHEKLPDGKYNFLLQGLMRARIVRELPVDKPYRVADLAGVVETTPSDSDLAPYRKRLQRLLQNEQSPTVDCVSQFEQLLQGSLPLGDVLDVITFTCLEDVALKQSLLAEPDVLRRVARVVEELERMSRQSQDRQMAAQRASLN